MVRRKMMKIEALYKGQVKELDESKINSAESLKKEIINKVSNVDLKDVDVKSGGETIPLEVIEIFCGDNKKPYSELIPEIQAFISDENLDFFINEYKHKDGNYGVVSRLVDLFDTLTQLDTHFVGTDKYLGLTYFWNYEYRHYLRDTSKVIWIKVHQAFLDNNLKVSDESDKHLEIIRKITHLL